MVEKHKMYAHIYFDIPANRLGIAVYALGKIPGFAGVLSEDLQELTKQRKAYKLFLKTLGEGEISPEELQQGRVFQYNRLEEKLKTLDILGKLIAKDKEAQVMIDLDDPKSWLEMKLKNLPEEKQYVIRNLPEEKKIELGEELRKKGMLDGLLNVDSTEELHQELEKLYLSVSRSLYPSSGAKDFPGTKKYPSPTPPTFLVSKEYDFAYYPGFRGAHYMTKIPQSDRYVHPHEKGTPSEQKWMLDLIPDTTMFLDQPLSEVEVPVLDTITETLARQFFQNLSGTSFADFNKAASAVRKKAETLMINLVESSEYKVASSKVGSWIDLQTGAVFKTEQELLAAMQAPEERLPLAAEKKINKLAKYFLKKRNLEMFCKLMRRI